MNVKRVRILDGYLHHNDFRHLPYETAVTEVVRKVSYNHLTLIIVGYKLYQGGFVMSFDHEVLYDRNTREVLGNINPHETVKVV